jgi:hypothetical protein
LTGKRQEAKRYPTALLNFFQYTQWLFYEEVEDLARQLLENHLEDLSLESIGLLMSVLKEDMVRMRPVQRIINNKVFKILDAGGYVDRTEKSKEQQRVVQSGRVKRASGWVLMLANVFSTSLLHQDHPERVSWIRRAYPPLSLKSHGVAPQWVARLQRHKRGEGHFVAGYRG